VVLAAIATIGLLLRAGPLVVHGTFDAGPDYDDGVNFVAAALLSEGLMPYRDFFYAHPPGALLVLGPLAALSGAIGPDNAFSLAGFAFAGVGDPGLPVGAMAPAARSTRARVARCAGRGAEVRRLASDACVFSFQPVDLLAGGAFLPAILDSR